MSTRFDWRTCKQAEAEVIHGYLFEQWIREYQAREPELDAEREERERYERARDAGDRAADRFR